MQHTLTSGRLLIKNSAFNLAGKLIPMALAIVTLPYVIQHLGDAKAGIFQLSWVLLGYFNLFDFGIGRAMVKFASESVAKGQNEDVNHWMVTVNRILWLISVPLVLVMIFVIPLFMANESSIPVELVEETKTAAYGIALYIPFLLTFFSYIGVLETWQRFDIINKYQVVYGVLWYLIPVIGLQFTDRIDVLVFSLLIMRLLHWMIIRWHAHHLMLGSQKGEYRPNYVPQLLKFSKWIVLINLAALFISHIDRMIIYWFIDSATMVWYNTPFDVVLKVTVIPMAFAGVLFPAFAHAYTGDKERANFIYRGYRNVTLLLVFPLCAFLSFLAPELISTWLSLSMEADRLAVFMKESILPMKWLVIGVLAISVGLIPSSYLQSTGRPDLIAKVHLIQIPFFLAALIFALSEYGITGVAAVVSIRMITDTLILITLVWRLQNQAGLHLLQELWPILISMLILIIPFWPLSLAYKISLLLISVISVVYLVWKFGMRPEEREFIYIKLGLMKAK
jgi:O-antigen/teichoic acid export membrane protein